MSYNDRLMLAQEPLSAELVAGPGDELDKLKKVSLYSNLLKTISVSGNG